MLGEAEIQCNSYGEAVAWVIGQPFEGGLCGSCSSEHPVLSEAEMQRNIDGEGVAAVLTMS